jgi:seryl-tRNA synthetase
MTSITVPENGSPALPGALEEARQRFRDDLLEAGLLLDAGVPGLYGRSGDFEDLVSAFQRTYVAGLESLNATRLLFPPVIARSEFEKTDYIASFPDLVGAVESFKGGNREHADLLAARAQGEPWDSWLSPAETMLVPAVCHPLYGRLSGQTLPEGGRVFDVVGYVFRHEPAVDPMRMQVFRQHEFIYVGDEQGARDFRALALGRLHDLLVELGLDATVVAANDPFFGRAGRMLARNQREEELKFEVVVPIYGDLDEGTAISSGNCHEEHFGQSFAITAADGTVAQTACIGAGLERITLALLRTHGLDPAAWPAPVRERLGLDDSRRNK